MIVWSLYLYTRGIKVDNIVKIGIQCTYPISGMSNMENLTPFLGAIEDDVFTPIESQVGVYMVGLGISIDHSHIVGDISIHVCDYYIN